MPIIQIRQAQHGDHDAIWAILKPIFRTGDTYAIDPDISDTDAIAYWTAAKAYIAEIEDKILGTYYLKPNQQGGGAHVCNCGYATHPEARGKGIASAMLDHSLAEARGLGFRAMQFNFVLATNTGAIRLWQRAGFKQVGRLPGVFLHPDEGYVDALVLHKHLTEPE